MGGIGADKGDDSDAGSEDIGDESSEDEDEEEGDDEPAEGDDDMEMDDAPLQGEASAAQQQPAGQPADVMVH